MEIVFVYGTLKRGFSNHVLLLNQKFLGNGVTVDKYVMYANGIPYVSDMFKSSEISGELYQVSKSALHYMDLLEGHPEWYIRKKTSIKYIDKSGNHKKINAWLYFNDNIPNNAKLIEQGIYGETKRSSYESLL